MNRRGFVLSCLTGALAGCAEPDATVSTLPPGDLLGTSLAVGHLLRAGRFAAPSAVQRIPVLIIGAGIGGLSAGWKLDRAGFDDFAIVELEPEAGGNSRHGANSVSAYPWGAHYLPLPTSDSLAVREMLAGFDVLQGDPSAARPRYDERFLCHAPQERLYRNGLWQEGLLPHIGVTRGDRDQYARFHDLIAGFRRRRDARGRKAFALPLDLSARDADLLELDRVTMRDWLLAQGLTSPPLHWYVNYACRDDYGTDYAETSAWAGVHYFACRDGEAMDAAADTVLTAPEGNGWIVRRLMQRLQPRLRTDSLVCRIAETEEGVEVDFFQPAVGRTQRFVARQAIWAAPLFVLPHVWEGMPHDLIAAVRGFAYAPWLVANLTLTEPPPQRAGASLAWDNVLYDGPGLGYVVATHQTIRTRPGPTVLTYYRALSDRTPKLAREELLATGRTAWAERILGELEKPHPDLRRLTTRLDVFRHAHAMVRPLPGTVWNEKRQRLKQGVGRLHFAHADVSGMSLFEEANYRGVLAAERALRYLGVPFASSLG